MITVEKLRSIGISPEDGLGRCLNNEEFYLSLVKMIPGDEGFSKLEEAYTLRESLVRCSAALERFAREKDRYHSIHVPD